MNFGKSVDVFEIATVRSEARLIEECTCLASSTGNGVQVEINYRHRSLLIDQQDIPALLAALPTFTQRDLEGVVRVPGGEIYHSATCALSKS